MERGEKSVRLDSVEAFRPPFKSVMHVTGPWLVLALSAPPPLAVQCPRSSRFTRGIALITTHSRFSITDPGCISFFVQIHSLQPCFVLDSFEHPRQPDEFTRRRRCEWRIGQSPSSGVLLPWAKYPIQVSGELVLARLIHPWYAHVQRFPRVDPWSHRHSASPVPNIPMMSPPRQVNETD